MGHPWLSSSTAYCYAYPRRDSNSHCLRSKRNVSFQLDYTGMCFYLVSSKRFELSLSGISVLFLCRLGYDDMREALLRFGTDIFFSRGALIG